MAEFAPEVVRLFARGSPPLPALQSLIDPIISDLPICSESAAKLPERLE
jgi:hypothetical protein